MTEDEKTYISGWWLGMWTGWMCGILFAVAMLFS